jgi:hypothetical protein
MSFMKLWNNFGRAENQIIFLLIAGMLLFAPHKGNASNANDDQDRQILIDITQNYFNAIASKDIDSLRNYLLPEAQFIYRNGESLDSAIAVTSLVDLLTSLPELNTKLVERMKEPHVLVQGDIGIVWTRYDLYVDKIFSHCGRDAFTFLKTIEGWKMASGSWTVEKKTCKPSPLGVPIK